MRKAKIEQVEPQLAQKLDGPWKNILQELNFIVPDNGYRLRVSLHNAKRRKKPSNAAADNWSPASSDRAEIWFEPAPQQKQKETASDTPRSSESSSAGTPERSSVDIAVENTYVHPAEADLLKALDRAEAKPGWSFVPLKKFRDEILPSEHVPSIRTDVERRHILRTAIEKKFILVGRVLNPKAPEFPVTTIRLNRMIPEVQRVLGQEENTDSDFHPIEIPGEPLSRTVLRERR